MGFEPCKIETYIWLLPHGEDYYECVSVYSCDLLIASKEPKSATDVLTNKHYFKLKGTGPISYNLGCGFGRDDDGTLIFLPKKHVETMVGCYYNMFGTKFNLSFSSPLEKGDRPELETSEPLDSDGVQKQQSMIGAIHWDVSLGRIDVNTAVMTLASFIAEHAQGHLDRCGIIVSYLAKFKCTTIRIRTDEPDLSSVSTTPYDWEE